MLYEVADLKRAFQAYIDGHDVKVMLPMNEEEERVVPLEKLFSETRLLVDRKPAINQDFEDAFQPPPNTEGVDSEPSGGAAEPASGPVGAGDKRKKVDRGKVMALHRAGWTNRKIADEMQIHESTVCRVIRDEIEKETIARIAGE